MVLKTVHFFFFIHFSRNQSVERSANWKPKMCLRCFLYSFFSSSNKELKSMVIFHISNQNVRFNLSFFSTNSFAFHTIFLFLLNSFFNVQYETEKQMNKTIEYWIVSNEKSITAQQSNCHLQMFSVHACFFSLPNMHLFRMRQKRFCRQQCGCFFFC